MSTTIGTGSSLRVERALPSGGARFAARVECGASTGHCCWVAGAVCPFLRDDGAKASRRWVCTLRERLGSWEAVHADPGYLTVVAPVVRPLGVDCGDWPPPGQTCAECGVSRDG